jgi:hypothetical protein
MKMRVYLDRGNHVVCDDMLCESDNKIIVLWSRLPKGKEKVQNRKEQGVKLLFLIGWNSKAGAMLFSVFCFADHQRGSPSSTTSLSLSQLII